MNIYCALLVKGTWTNKLEAWNSLFSALQGEISWKQHTYRYIVLLSCFPHVHRQVSNHEPRGNGCKDNISVLLSYYYRRHFRCQLLGAKSRLRPHVYHVLETFWLVKNLDNETNQSKFIFLWRSCLTRYILTRLSSVFHSAICRLTCSLRSDTPSSKVVSDPSTAKEIKNEVLSISGCRGPFGRDGW